MVERDELEHTTDEEKRKYVGQFEEQEEKCKKQRSQVDAERLNLVDLKRQVALMSTYSRSGRSISPLELRKLRRKISSTELRKLRRKISSTVQVMTHLKEKIEFVKGENLIQSGKLQEVETYVSHVS
ncbi:hypothetical protein ACOMHN_041863 [Nucella lapillus]